MQQSEDHRTVKILTYCHDCQAAYTGQGDICLACGATDSLLWFLAGACIKDWLEKEARLEAIEKI